MGAKSGVTFAKKRYLMSVMEPRSLSVATAFSKLSDTLTFVLLLKHRFQGPQCRRYRASSEFPTLLSSSTVVRCSLNWLLNYWLEKASTGILISKFRRVLNVVCWVNSPASEFRRLGITQKKAHKYRSYLISRKYMTRLEKQTDSE